jgi:hypothetical protein
MVKAGFVPEAWPEALEAARFRVESFGAPWRSADRDVVGAAKPEPPALH